MKTKNAALIAASAFLCLLGVWCDAGCARDAERESATKAEVGMRFAVPSAP